MPIKSVLIPIPDKDFDTTEVAITWKILKAKGNKIVFATENGVVGATDPLLLTGVIFGQLGAKKDAIEAYHLLLQSDEFQHPIKYNEIHPAEFDLLFLPGGHAKGMRQYLESKTLQQKVVEFFKLNKLVGSVCHGPLVLARSIDPATGKSVIYDYKITALTKSLEKLAYYLTKWKLGDYYRTYPAYVQDEIGNYLHDKNNFETGVSSFIPFLVEDRNLITARWPNDVEKLANKLAEKLK
ncbi:MAG: DJ-1/PfpI family protein [Sphingobacteriales bacterium]|nr:DJ-1/PfpI family protein [Sphingobacteriales bacterium]MBP8192242.1 DJ-1/PfpI family protein [Chitinophagales bacterium]